jgi:hypothetical protein
LVVVVVVPAVPWRCLHYPTLVQVTQVTASRSRSDVT